MDNSTVINHELGSMIQKIDHFVGKKQRKRADSIAAAIELKSAGTQIRQEALNRASGQHISTPKIQQFGEDDSGHWQEISLSSSSVRKRLFEQSEHEQKEIVLLHSEGEERERQSMELDEERLDLKMQGTIKEAQNNDRLTHGY